MGLLRCLYTSTRNFLAFFFIVALLPGLPPKTLFPIESITYAPTLPFTGVLTPNTLLDKAERLFQGRLDGPECLRQRDNVLYASQNGELVKIVGDHVTHVARFGKPCEPHDPEICGRPLGFDFDTLDQNTLIVADAYYGLWSVDLRTLRKTQLISPDQVLPGDVPRPAKIFNSVAIARNGDIYFTDSASDYDLIDGLYTFVTNPSGRLFHYSRATRQTTVLLDRLHFANGVALSPDESFIVVAETAASRLRRVHLTGPKRGSSDVFAEGLPGVPDNLSADREGIWVPLVLTLDPAVPIMLWQSAGEAPLVRSFTLRLMTLIELPVRLLHQVVPTVHTKRVLNYLGSFAVIAAVTPKRSTILRVDWNGQIVSSLSGADGSVTTVAHVLEWNNDLYLGSFNNGYLAKVRVPKGLKRGEALFAAAENPKVVTTTPKPTTTTTPKPTTTTPKPTTAAPKPTTTTQKPTTTTTTTQKPTTTAKPVTTTTTTKKPTTTTPKPTTTTAKPVTQKPTTTTTTTSKPAPAKPTKPTVAAPAAHVPPPPPPPTPEQPPRNVPATPQPIEEQHEEPTRPPPPPKMKVIKRGGEQGEF